MPDTSVAVPVRRAAALVAALLSVALIAWCSARSTRYRRMTGFDRCLGMPVYAGPVGPLVGYLIGGALVDPGLGPSKRST